MGQRVEGPFPTFKLKILEEFFRRENYDSLVTCLRQCGQGLVEVEMIIPKNGGSLPGILPPVDLPIMHALSTTLTNQKVAGPMPNIIGLIQTLLNGTGSRGPSLKIFTVPSFGPTNSGSIAPRNLEFVTFPESITELELNCLMSNENLELLTRNKLPNLLTLKLLLRNVSYPEGLLSKIMDNFSEHLRKLIVYPVSYSGTTRHVNYVRFPVMKKLSKFELLYYGLELEEGHPPLSNCFPKLEVLSLHRQTPEMLRKWTVQTSLDSVQSLSLWLIDESKPERNFENTLPLTLESMQLVHLSFPNITELTLRLSSGPQECGLKYLFMEMRLLTYLKIIVDGNESVVSSDHWDSVFTGLPVPVVAAFRETDSWEGVELDTKDGVPTIRMLTALKVLVLATPQTGEEALPSLPPLISNVTFAFALMKMKNLKKLGLRGRFGGTKQMRAKRNNMGRQITYSNSL